MGFCSLRLFVTRDSGRNQTYHMTKPRDNQVQDFLLKEKLCFSLKYPMWSCPVNLKSIKIKSAFRNVQCSMDVGLKITNLVYPHLRARNQRSTPKQLVAMWRTELMLPILELPCQNLSLAQCSPFSAHNADTRQKTQQSFSTVLSIFQI